MKYWNYCDSIIVITIPDSNRINKLKKKFKKSRDNKL